MSREVGTKKERLIQELGQEFRVSGIHDIAFDEVVADRLGINRTDLNCLDVIQRHGGVTAGELAAEAGLTTGAVTGVADRLEHKGYVRRVRDAEDRRKVKLEVTPEFMAKAEEIYGPMIEEWNQLMQRPTIEQLEAMLEFMRAGNEVKPRHIERVRAMRTGRESDGGERR
jgi:DNA-binding MarR family transcriptional regulator